MPLVATCVSEDRYWRKFVVIVDDVSRMSSEIPELLGTHSLTHVKYTIASRPLFKGTVSAASESSVT